MDWSTWVQQVAGGVISKAADARFVQPYEVQKLRLEALGDLGYYTEGQAGAKSTTGPVISPTVLLLGAGLLAVLMLKD